MTVSATTPRNDYIGNNATATYSYTFRIFDATDLKVVISDVAGNQTVLTYPTDYTVTGVNRASGGTVVLNGNLPTGELISILFNRTPRQSTDLRNQGSFYPEVHENKFDELTRYVQQLEERNTRTLKIPQPEVGETANTTLPTASTRANKFLAFDANGRPVAASGTSANLGPVSSFAATLLDDESAAGARATLGAVGRVSTITALKNLNPATLTTGDVTIVEGYYAAGDMGGGSYWWDGSSSATDNGGTIIQPAAGGTGRWKLLHTGTVTVLQFGAKGDGTTNDRNAIQAALNYCAANNQHLHMPGWLTSGTEATWRCTSGLTVPSNRGFKWTMHGGHLWFNGLGASSGLIVDSCMITDIELMGEVIYDGTANAVAFYPTSDVPVDAFKLIIDSRFYIQAIVNTNQSSSDANVLFNADEGNITNNVFGFAELNGEGAPGGGGITDHGIVVTAPGNSLAFSDNYITCPHIHNHNISCVQLGVNTTRASQIARNKWDVNCFPNNTKNGFDCYGVHQYGTVNVLPATGTPGIGIKFQSSSENCYLISTNLSATTPVNDSSTGKNNLVMYKASRARTSITVGASPYTYQNTSGRVEHVTVSGGTVSAVDISVDGTNFYATGFTGGTIILMPGDSLKVTYSGLPTMNRFR